MKINFKFKPKMNREPIKGWDWGDTFPFSCSGCKMGDSMTQCKHKMEACDSDMRCDTVVQT